MIAVYSCHKNMVRGVYIPDKQTSVAYLLRPGNRKPTSIGELMRMKRLPSLLLLIVCIGAGVGIQSTLAQTPIAQPDSAQAGCMCIKNSLAQTPCAHRGASPSTAQEIIARRQIQERIDQTIEADEAKDVAAAMHFDTADFAVKNRDGSVSARADVRKGIQQGYDWFLAVSDKTRVSIDCLTLKGNEASVYINQHFVRTVPDRKDGSPHELITNVTHRETWIQTDQGWLRKYLEELQEGPIFLDSQPYNPE